MQKIVSLNLNGIRAAWRKNLAAWIYNQQNLPDVICFQEIKAQIPDSSDEMINPKNILILKDVDRYFNTDVISVETDEEKHCAAKLIKEYKLKNTLFDGQALIDSSIFPDCGNGYILLRHHFCKMAAFCSNIQLFFRDYFGDNYYSATVKDMWGNKHYVKDIDTESIMLILVMFLWKFVKKEIYKENLTKEFLRRLLKRFTQDLRHKVRQVVG